VGHTIRRFRGAIRKALLLIAATIICFYILLPILTMASLSIRPASEMRMYKGLIRIPSQPTLENFVWIFQNTFFARNLLNTVIIGGTVALIGIFSTVFTAYSLARFRYRFLGPLAVFLLLLQMFPSVLMLIPLYLIWVRLKLINTYASLIFTYSTFIIPFCVWMLRAYFQGIPQELEEAAMVDGCSRTQAVFKIVLPAIAPGIIAVGLYSFVLAWQEFLFASVLITNNKMATVTSSIYMFAGSERTAWSPLASQSIMAIIPVAILFVYMQKFLIAGLTAGAVKG